MRIMRIMNPMKYIRTKVFSLDQAPFAADVAEVSQPTVSRWENDKFPGSQPSRDDMDRIRKKAIERGIDWNDGWFFKAPDDAEQESAA